MNAIPRLDTADLWLFAGWTMIHFLWLGTLVGVAAAVSRLILRRAAANLRYTITLAWLLALAALPFITATWLLANSHPLKGGARGWIAAPLPAHPFVTLEEPQLQTDDVTSTQTTHSLELTDNDTALSVTAASSIDSKNAIESLTFATLTTLQACIPYLPLLWLIGTPATLALLLTGLVGSRRLNRASHHVTEGHVATLLSRLVTSLNITRQVSIAICDRIAAPVLIGILRPVILLPPSALTGWSPDEIEMVLLHELAHVRRWDNLVNLLQRFIESLLFFHPAVWIISTWVRRDRESCCDALVVGRTNRPHAYAEMLVALAAQMPRSVLFHPAASSAMAAGPLRYRIRRILQLEDDPMLVSGKSLALVLGSLLITGTLALLYFPADSHAEPSAQETSTAAPNDANTTSSPSIDKKDATVAFPHEVKFERGAKRFLEGDEITIDEVRGTAKTFEPGNKYWIRGTYKLKSQDRAQLLAYVITKDDASTPNDPHQTRVVERGSGDFTLVLPMAIDGWPRVTLNPVGGGWEFGGVYFGPGDKVLKKWREEKPNFDAPQLAFELKKGTTGNVDLYLNGKQIDRDELQKSITQYNDWQNKPVSLSADRGTDYKAVMDLIDQLESIGVKKLALDTRSIRSDAIRTDEGQPPPALLAAQQQAQTINNLKDLTRALLNHNDAHKAFPAQAAFDSAGKPLLSWRVLILPFLGEADLFREFKLDEPWDSEHNCKLISRMPAVFKNPRIDDPGKTNYLAVVGPQCLFTGTAKPTRMAEITDGTANTIALVEADASVAVEWTKPQDWEFDRKQPVHDLGHLWPGKFNAFTIDGAHRPVNLNKPADEIGILFTRGGGEVKSLSESRDRIGQPGPGMEGGLSAQPEGGFDGGPPVSSDSNKTASKFPSLEQQRLADLAFKRLNLELQSLSAADLERVKAFGYDGGVMVASGSAGFSGQNKLEGGDILVGLHAWPTTSMRDVAAILNRDDLAEIGPLKFYAIAQSTNFDDSGKETAKKDFVSTGRVDVKPKWNPGSQRPDNSGDARDLQPSPMGGGMNAQMGSMGMMRPAANNPTATSSTLQPVSSIYFFYSKSSAPSQQMKPIMARAAKEFPHVAMREVDIEDEPEMALLMDVKQVPVVVVVQNGVVTGRLVGVLPLDKIVSVVRASTASESKFDLGSTFVDPVFQVFDPSAEPRPAALRPAPPNAIPLLSRQGLPLNALLYEDKTFDQWRNHWKTELSTQRRTEAVQALGAFARAGYGTEAIDTILDVAADYDFQILDDSPEGKLKAAIVQVLAPAEGQSILAPYWVPVLFERLKAQPLRWQGLAGFLLDRLRSGDDKVLAALETYADAQDAPLRAQAVGAIIVSMLLQPSTPELDEKLRKRIDAALESTDPSVVGVALMKFNPSSNLPLAARHYRIANLSKLLLQDDENVRVYARLIARDLDEKSATPIVNELLAALEKNPDPEALLKIIRALSIFRGYASSAIKPLRDLMQNRDKDMSLRIASAVALDRIQSTTDNNVYLTKQLQEETDEIARNRAFRVLNKEQQLSQQQ